MTDSAEVRIVLEAPQNVEATDLEAKVRSLNDLLKNRFPDLPPPRPVVDPTLASRCGCPELARLTEIQTSSDKALEFVRAFRAIELLEASYRVQIQTIALVGDEPWDDLPICPDQRSPKDRSDADPDTISQVKHGLLLDDGRPPSFHAMQRYLGPASEVYYGGIEAAVAWSLPGGRGAGVRIADIEKAWGTHRDIRNPLPIPGSTYLEHHGTAVEGLLSARNDGIGIDGIASDACLLRVPVGSFQPANVANALCGTVAALDPGDVILLETKYRIIYPDGDGGSCTSPDLPHETADNCICILKRAVNKGIHVIQAAGNGGVDIDPYLSGREDTGSIVVAAGQPAIGTRVAASNWGNRVNLFSWGHSVVAPSGLEKNSDLWHTAGARYAYFNGTSAAAAIVAGAVACLSGILKAAGKSLPPHEMRQLLVDTGYAKKKSEGNQIGVHPNLRAACLELQRRKLIPEGSVL